MLSNQITRPKICYPGPQKSLDCNTKRDAVVLSVRFWKPPARLLHDNGDADEHNVQGVVYLYKDSQE